MTPRIASAAAIALAAACSGRAAPIPAEDLFRSNVLGESALSPDGRHLGTIVTDEADVKNLIATKRRYDGDAPRGPKVLTGRSFYAHGARRYSGNGWDD